MGVLDKFDQSTKFSATVELILDKAVDAEWRKLAAELDDAAVRDHGSLAMPATTKIIQQMDALRDQVEASKVTFAFDQLDPFDYIELQAAHPPKPGVMADQLQGWDSKLFPRALIMETCVSVTDATATRRPRSPRRSGMHCSRP